MASGIMECGKKYLIIYDDRGNKPVKKIGIVDSIVGNLITLDSGEVLNSNLVIRAQPVDGGICGEKGQD